MGNQVAPNMIKQVFFVMKNLCLSGRTTAINLSIVSGSRASKPEYAKLDNAIVYATQLEEAVLFDAPTNLLSIIPSPLKNPMIDNKKSLTATLMIRRLLQLGSLILRRLRK